MAAEKDANPPFDADTPLSALFRESHHEELRQIIESWRPYLSGDDPNMDALALNSFQFDFGQTRPVCIYMDLARLTNLLQSTTCRVAWHQPPTRTSKSPLFTTDLK